MLIRSQDKSELLNMDVMSELTFTIDYADDKPIQWNITAVRAVNGATEIGSYSSEDKALAVLDEIMYNYARNKDAEYFQAGIPNSCYVFEMPADDDPWFDRRDDNEQVDKDNPV